MNSKYEKILYNLSLKAYKSGEIPVAALVVMDNKILSTAYNKRNRKNNPLYHAEIRAIIKAARKIGDWRLNKCTLYVTLEPCHMCKEIIKEARIQNVVYFVQNFKQINYKSNFNYVQSDYSSKYKKLLTTFFKKLR